MHLVQTAAVHLAVHLRMVMLRPGRSSHAPTTQPLAPETQMLAVQRELPPEQAVVIAARTGCTAEAVLDFWQRRLEARARCLREARERAAASAAAAAAEGKPAFVIPATDAEMHALIASAAAAREAATAKLRALQDAAGKGLRDASVTGKTEGGGARDSHVLLLVWDRIACWSRLTFSVRLACEGLPA